MGPLAHFLVAVAALGTTPAAAQSMPDLAEVAADVRARDEAAALATLARQGAAVRRSAPVQYLRGRLLERQGNARDAAVAFAAAVSTAAADSAAGSAGSGLPAAVRTDARRREVSMLARAGDCEQALSRLEAAREELRWDDPRAAAGASMRAIRGECLARTGDHDAALASLREVAAEDAADVDTFAVRFTLAQVLLDTGERPGAIAELRALVVDRPEHPDAGAVEAWLVREAGPLSFTAAEHVSRAERFTSARDHARAIVELDAAGRPRERQQLAQWLHLKGMALYRTRQRYAEAATVLGESSRRSRDNPHAIEDEFHRARALARADRNRESIRAFRRFVQRHPRHSRAALAEYLAAWLEIRGQGRRAAVAMRRFANGPRARANRALRQDATWHVAFHDFESGRFDEAAAGFDAYARLDRSVMVRGRGLYWLGRARQESGDRRQAAAAFREVLPIEPLHWYALLAQQRLVELGEDPGDPFGPPAEPRPAAAPLTLPPLPDDARFYARLGLLTDAARSLGRAESRIRAASPSGRELESLVTLYHQLGEYARPYRLVASSQAAELQRRPDPQNQWIWDAAYPRPYADAVAETARREQLAPEYLWAIMRQESAYDSEAVSYADAIGLLQLLPSTAERLARGMGLSYARNRLFDPAWNVRVAGRYNAELLGELGGATPLALAGFNAGGHRVAQWLQSTGEVDLDRFVERIPIDQTHNYVRRVTSHHARYAYLASPERGWSLALPRTVGPQTE